MNCPESNWSQHDDEMRRCIRLTVIGLLIGCALAWSLKYLDLIPPHLTWLDLTVGPAVLFASSCSMFGGVLWLRHHWERLFASVTLLGVAIILALVWWERG